MYEEFLSKVSILGENSAPLYFCFNYMDRRIDPYVVSGQSLWTSGSV